METTYLQELLLFGSQKEAISSATPQNTTCYPRTDTYTPPTQERTLPPCAGRTPPLFYPYQTSYLDEVMKGIMRLSSELADICQRDLQARVWIARDTGALKLRLT